MHACTRLVEALGKQPPQHEACLSHGLGTANSPPFTLLSPLCHGMTLQAPLQGEQKGENASGLVNKG